MARGDTYTAKKPCKRGHEPLRYASNRKCVACCTQYERAKVERLCDHCGESFQSRQDFPSKYCSTKCKDAVRGLKYQEQKASRYKERLARRDHMRAVKLKKGCEVCGYNSHPSALEFDHIDPATKTYSPSYTISLSWGAMLEEIAKCRVLCANCHAVHTYNQREGTEYGA